MDRSCYEQKYFGNDGNEQRNYANDKKKKYVILGTRLQKLKLPTTSAYYDG